MKRVLWGVGMDVQAHVLAVALAHVLAHVDTLVREHAKVVVKDVDIRVPVRVKTAAQEHADIRVLVNYLQDSFGFR